MACPASFFFSSQLGKTRNLRAFTLVELLAVLAIVAILGSLATLGVQRAMLAARITQSRSNLRQVSVVFNSYVNDNRGVYPMVWDSDTNQSWIAALWPYIYENRRFPGTSPAALEGSIFYTPLVEDDTIARTFGMNDLLQKRMPARRFKNFATPGLISLVGDTKDSGTFRLDQVNYRNNGRANVLFLDGHVGDVGPADVPTSTTSQFWAGGLNKTE